MQNAFAYLVFWSWPLGIVALFMRLRLDLALVLAIVVGYMFLPQEILYRLSPLPPLTRNSITAYTALLMCLAVQRTQPGFPAWQAAGWLPRTTPMLLLLVAYFLCPIPSVLTNGDVQFFGDRLVPALSITDAPFYIYRQLPGIVVYVLARRYLGSQESQRTLLYVLLGVGLVYSLLMLAELRLSPILHERIYGSRGFQWLQQVRNDGYRPVVFLNHGLWTAIALAMCTIAAAALWRSETGGRRGRLLIATVWLCLVLVLSNSFGALLIGMVLIPAALFLSTAQRFLLAGAIAATVLLYPMVRGAGYVPTTAIVNFLDGLGPEFRGGSLRYRFDNEDILLDRANKRPLFGWGGAGRNRVFNDQGEDVSVTDGRWIILFGSYGWFGYIAEYGLLGGPILLLFLRRRQLGDIGPSLGLGLVLCANLVDIIPNATATPLTWLVAGAMLGRVEQPARGSVGAQAPPGAVPGRRPFAAVLGRVGPPATGPAPVPQTGPDGPRLLR